MPDSLHKSTTGATVDFRANLDTEIDPGPWGQSKLITFRGESSKPSIAKETIIRGSRFITPLSGEPQLRTCTITVDDECSQPGVVAGFFPELYDVHLVAVVNYGIGGANQSVELSVRKGVTFTIPASFWDISLYIEPMPDPNNYTAGAPLYPNNTTGPKTVRAQCSCALGTRPSALSAVARDTPFRFPVVGAYAEKLIKIPKNAINVSFVVVTAGSPFTYAAKFPATGFAAPWDSVIAYADTTPGVKTPIPVGASHLIVSTTDPLADNKTVFVTWEILL